MQLTEQQKNQFINDHLSMIVNALRESIKEDRVEIDTPGKEFFVTLPNENGGRDVIARLTVALLACTPGDLPAIP